MRLFSFIMILALTACVSNPSYVEVGKGAEELKPGDVNYKLSGLFYRDPPDCVSVMETKAENHPQMKSALSVALARHLGEKVDRVIFPRKRLEVEKRQGYDLKDKRDRLRYSVKTRCRFYARAELYDLGDDYVGVFAKKHLGVRVDINRFEDDQPLWQAAHTVWRADGGVPTSPIGLIGGVASATMFKADQEVMPSLIDDAMRRMVRTLPASF